MDAERRSAAPARRDELLARASAPALPTVLFLGGIGDQLLALPALRALSERFEGRLRLAVVGQAPRVLSTVPLAEHASIAWDGYRLDPSALVGCSLLVSLTSWPNARAIHELLRESGVPRSIGFFPCYGERVAFDPEQHMSEKYFAVARHLDPTLVLERYEGPARFAPEITRRALAKLSALRRPGRRLAFFHPETKPHKQWPRERWCALLRQLLERAPDLDLVVITAEPYPLELGALAARVLPFHEPLEPTLAALVGADLFVGVDSCFLHAADALGVPGLALFGPTEPASWGFRRSRAFAHVCAPSGALDQLAVEEAWRALSALLERLNDEPRNIAP